MWCLRWTLAFSSFSELVQNQDLLPCKLLQRGQICPLSMSLFFFVFSAHLFPLLVQCWSPSQQAFWFLADSTEAPWRDEQTITGFTQTVVPMSPKHLIFLYNVRRSFTLLRCCKINQQKPGSWQQNQCTALTCTDDTYPCDKYAYKKIPKIKP